MENCEFCGKNSCQCDRDDNNPVDVSAEKWSEIYSDPDFNIDHDHSMDGFIDLETCLGVALVALFIALILLL